MVNYEPMGVAGMRAADPAVVAKLRAKLTDPSTTLAQKYRILFSLRNLAGPEAHEAMLLGNAFQIPYKICRKIVEKQCIPGGQRAVAQFSSSTSNSTY